VDAIPPIVLGRYDELPGVVLNITGISGGSGPGGAFSPGDIPTVAFTVKKSNGAPLSLAQLASASILVSGPTHNYQRVVTPKSDVLTRSVAGAVAGAYSYTFELPLPAAYLAPVNDSASFGRESGELTGDPLEGGTYTVGMQASATYMNVRDGAGVNIPLNQLTRCQGLVTGPTKNPQVVIPAVLPFDTGFRKAPPFTGSGSISRVEVADTAVAQTLAVIFKDANTFYVEGSVTDPSGEEKPSNPLRLLAFSGSRRRESNQQ
jgi:hypothetical protein